MLILVYLAIGVAIVAGLALLGRRREISEAEYESLKGKQSGIGNALLEIQSIYEPQRESLKKTREERQVEKDSGDPPVPGGTGRASSRR
jgi:hypothetical protein